MEWSKIIFKRCAGFWHLYIRLRHYLKWAKAWMSLHVDRLPTHILSTILQVISWYLVEYPLQLRKSTVISDHHQHSCTFQKLTNLKNLFLNWSRKIKKSTKVLSSSCFLSNYSIIPFGGIFEFLIVCKQTFVICQE